MVGVPGRSNACHNCRSRKIKCGAEKPSCHNCIKSDRICSGYQRTNAFILSKDMVGSGSELSESTENLDHDANSGLVLISRWRIDQAKTVPSNHKSSISTPPILPIRQVAPGNVFREQLVHFFLNHRVPAELLGRPRASEYAWMCEFLELPSLNPVLEHAVLALCTAHLGRQNGHETLFHESEKLYSTSMAELRQSLLNPASRFNDQIVAACFALTVHELTSCPGQLVSGYLSHYSGSMKLLQLRGPKSHASVLAHSVLRALRMHSIFHGLWNRSSTFLARKEWVEIPWVGTQKGLDDQVVDMLLTLPHMLSQTDAIHAASSPAMKLHLSLQLARMSLRIDADLSAWYTRFSDIVTGPLYWVVLSTTNNPADTSELGKLFPVSFRFPAFAVAQPLLLYWLGQFMVHNCLCHVYQILRGLMNSEDQNEMLCLCENDDMYATISTCPRHFKPQMLPPLGHRTEWSRTLGSNICQSSEYFLQDEMRSMGASLMMLVLLVVRGCWQKMSVDMSREILWINNVLAEIRTKGNEIAGSLDP